MPRPTPPPNPRKGAKVPDVVRRERALLRTMEKFQGRAMKIGRTDCIIMMRFHAVAMGHRKLPKMPKYNSAAGAMAALKAKGVKNVEELMDKFFERIPPASMLPGDAALVEAERGEAAWQAGTVVISVGRKWLAWHPTEAKPLAIIEPLVERPFKAAWRL